MVNFCILVIRPAVLWDPERRIIEDRRSPRANVRSGDIDFFFIFFLLIRPHCSKHSDRIQQTNLRPGKRLQLNASVVSCSHRWDQCSKHYSNENCSVFAMLRYEVYFYLLGLNCFKTRQVSLIDFYRR